MPDLSADDQMDFANADRGFIGKLEPGVVRAADGRVVWDNDRYSFLQADCPDTVHPDLWRQGQLCARQGLYEVTEGIYQVRGLDLSNMTLVEGETGVIVIDPLISVETAAAGLGLYRKYRGDRQVSAVIYTHSHVDHFGGILGVISPDNQVPILAPVHFMEHTVSENVYAGTAMLRRGMFFGGDVLEVGPTGQVGMGLGASVSTGTPSLLPPTLEVTHTGQEETLDGVRLIFQVTPGTEAPAEMNFLLPDRRALCMAENATHTLHNILTLRGAEVRDARMWARYLNESITMFADDCDVVFASHHWPTWGKDRIVSYLSQQRDTYAYLHDQTLRLMNKGYTGIEIAEILTLPPALRAAWHVQGYYGSVSHNVKAIYQRYMGWFDGNPASLWRHPPAEAGRRYVDTLGGPKQLLAKAHHYIDEGDLRFAAELLNHAVCADSNNSEAKTLLASVYDRLGYGAENGVWRNFYLTGARELREGVRHTAISSAGLAPALTVSQIFDSVAIRIDGIKAAEMSFILDWTFTDLDERYRMVLSNGTLIHWPVDHTADDANCAFRLTKRQLLQVVAGQGIEDIDHSGDIAVLHRLLAFVDDPDPDFPIVTRNVQATQTSHELSGGPR